MKRIHLSAAILAAGLGLPLIAQASASVLEDAPAASSQEAKTVDVFVVKASGGA